MTVHPRSWSLGLRLFGALALFVAVPTIVLVSLSDMALRNTISEEIGKTALEKLRIAHGIETLLDDQIQTMCMRISLDHDLNALGQARNFDEEFGNHGSRQYDFFNYLDRLDDSVRTNAFVRSIEIVFEDSNFVLSTESGTARRDQFVDREWLDSAIARLGYSGQSVFLPPHVPKNAAPDEVVVSFYYPFPPYLTDLRGAIIVHLLESEFSKRINDPGQGSGGSISLMDDHGTVVSAPNKRLLGKPLGIDLGWSQWPEPGDGGRLTIQRPDGEHLITWYRPDIGPWVYVGDLSLVALTRNVGAVRLTTALWSLAIVVVAVALFYLLASRFFHPVRRLIRQVNQRLGRDDEVVGNEFNLLSGAFDVLLKRETQLFHDLEAQRRRRDEEWVSKVLKGEGTGDLDDQTPKTLVGKQMIAGYLAIDRYPQFAETHSPEHREYLRTMVLHMAEQAFLPTVSGLGTVLDPKRFGLILATDERDSGAFADCIEDGFEVLRDEARRLLGTSLTLCLGVRTETLLDLASSWAGAEAQLNQRFLFGHGHWFWAENPTVADTLPFFPSKQEREIFAALDAKDPVSLGSSFEELRRQLVSRKGLGHDNVLLILHQLVGGIVRHLVDRRVDLSGLFGHGYDVHRALSEAETLNEALDWLGGILRTIMGLTSEEPDPRPVPVMVRFIRSEMHKDIGVEDVANAAGLSYSHARRVFEETMGESIIDYLNTLRIEEAKKLLLTTSLSLEEVARAVGYNNSQSLRRYFKKAKGVTLVKFRDSQK